LIVGARLKARNEGETAIGWHGERFARERKLKSLGDYLKPDTSTPSDGAANLRGMIARMKAKQEAVAKEG
jgi:hypothetical protein